MTKKDLGLLTFLCLILAGMILSLIYVYFQSQSGQALNGYWLNLASGPRFLILLPFGLTFLLLPIFQIQVY